MRKIEALEIAMKDYSHAIVYIATSCPVDKIRDYLKEHNLYCGLCHYFEWLKLETKVTFPYNEIPKYSVLFPMVCTARLEHYFDPLDYKAEVIKLLTFRHEYLIQLHSKYMIESHGLQRISVSAN